jgi:hypothetical protein
MSVFSFDPGPSTQLRDAKELQNKYEAEGNERIAVVALNEKEMAKLSSKKFWAKKLASDAVEISIKTAYVAAVGVTVAALVPAFAPVLSVGLLGAAVTATASVQLGWKAAEALDMAHAAKVMRDDGTRPVRYVENFFPRVEDERNTNPVPPVETTEKTLKKKVKDTVYLAAEVGGAGMKVGAMAFLGSFGAGWTPLAIRHRLQMNSEATPNDYAIQFHGSTTEGYRDVVIDSAKEIPAHLQPELQETDISVGGVMSDIHPEWKGMFYPPEIDDSRINMNQVAACYSYDKDEICMAEHIYEDLPYEEAMNNSLGVQALMEGPTLLNTMTRLYDSVDNKDASQGFKHEFGHHLYHEFVRSRLAYENAYATDIENMGGINAARGKHGQGYYVQDFNGKNYAHNDGENEALAQAFAILHTPQDEKTAANLEFENDFPNVMEYVKEMEGSWGPNYVYENHHPHACYTNSTLEHEGLYNNISDRLITNEAISDGLLTNSPSNVGSSSPHGLFADLVPDNLTDSLLHAAHTVSDSIADHMDQAMMSAIMSPRLLFAGVSATIMYAKDYDQFVGTHTDYLVYKTCMAAGKTKNFVDAAKEVSGRTLASIEHLSLGSLLKPRATAPACA